MKDTKPFIVAVAGGTASGKSYLCESIYKIAGPSEASVLLMDYYYRPQSHKSVEERATLNFDHPDALEFELLIEHLRKIKNGEEVEVPTYDFALHDRKKEKLLIKPTPLILVDGILVLYSEGLRNYFDFSIFIETPDDIRFNRRLERDIKERGRTAESVHAQWHDTVHPMHQQFCSPSKIHANLILGEGDITPESVKSLYENLKLSFSNTHK